MSATRLTGTNGAARGTAEPKPFIPTDSPYWNPSSQQLRKLVLAYLCHHCYVSTAKVLADSQSMESQLEQKAKTLTRVDADGDELMDVGNTSDMAVENMVALADETHANDLDEETLRIASLRAEIREHILEGRIEAARQLLDATFPAVLNVPPKPKIGGSNNSSPIPAPSPQRNPVSHKAEPTINESPLSLDPRHLSLNLHVQEFIESMRTVSLSRTRKLSDLPSSIPQPTLHSDPQKMLARAQSLSFLVSKLPSPADQALYMKELQNVSALMAYHIPEASPVAKYMGMERRETVAEQVNRAILYRTNQSPIPRLQRYAEHTTVVWNVLNELKVPMPPTSACPPEVAEFVGPVVAKGELIARPFDLANFVSSLP